MMRRLPSNQRRRAGITLMEVLLATAIFMGSLTAILRVIQMGHESRLSARLDNEAALRCERVMGEYVSGIRPLVTASGETFDDDPTGNWRFSTQIVDEGGESLLKITVLVEHFVSDEQSNAYFQLVRLMRDPQLFLDAALEGEGE